MTKEEIRENNIEKVLNEAIICFKEYGVEQTTILLLAKRTGLTTRSINRYFGEKNKLVTRAAELFLTQAFERVEVAFKQNLSNNCNGLQQVSAYLKIQYEIFRRDFSRLMLLSEMERYLYVYGSNEVSGKRLFSRYLYKTNEYEAMFSKALEKGIHDGTIKSDINIAKMSRMICISFISFFQRMAFYLMSNEIRNEQEVNEQYELFAQMIEYNLANLDCYMC